jgi:serine/threonine protein kinase/tetratricopeptide (TPR) repeat protein
VAIKCPKCQTENPEDTFYCGKCATPLPPSKDISVSQTETLQTPVKELTTGSTFAGRYQIIEELGHGGMGRVYRALDLKLNEEVALKLVKPEIALDKGTLERFHNELKLARKVSHRNIGRMYELLEDRGYHFITMEYVPGQDLRGLIKQTGVLTAGKAVSIAKQVCEGLSEAHRLGIIHRDLKPSNIIIDKEGNARIMDFGIARTIRGKGLTGEGIIIGTPEYMSPEQVEGKETDQRSDIYSLGIILYEMLTGRVPFEGDTPFTVGIKHKSETPKNPRELNSQIPEDLSRLILHCLEKDKGKRYQTADDLKTDLEKTEKGLPMTAFAVPKRKTFTSKEITVKFELKKALIPAFGIIAIAAIALLIWRFLPRKPAALPLSGKPSLAILYFENISGDKNLDTWKTGLTELLITKLSQSKFITILSSDRVFSILRKLNLAEAKRYSTEDLVNVANEGRANYTLNGTIMKAGPNIVVTLTLQMPRTGEVISPISVECKGEEEIIPKVDELAVKIKSDLNLSSEQISADIDKAAGKITTSSPVAYKYYIEGRKLHHEGEERQGILLMEKAVAVDPEFAMAYRSMAMGYTNLGYKAESREHLEKAMQFADRISDRERYIIQGDYYRESEKSYDKAIEAYNNLLALYPDDNIGNVNLAILYTNLEDWDQAIKYYNVQIQNKDESYFSYFNISDPYMAKGLYEKSREVQESYVQNFKENYYIHVGLSINYFVQGNYDLALAEADKTSSLNPSFFINYMARGDIYRDKGDFLAAEKEYQKLFDLDEQVAHIYGRYMLAPLYLMEGKYKEAERQANLGIELAEKIGDKVWQLNFLLGLEYIYNSSGHPEKALEACNKAWGVASETDSSTGKRTSLLDKGIAYLAMNSPDEAQKTGEELKDLIERGINKKAIRYYHLLMGRIELQKQRYSSAIEYFQRAINLLPYQHDFGDDHAVFMAALASAYEKAGDVEKARQQYEKISRLTSGRFYYGDIYARSFYMLGKIADQLGEKSKARENYQKFLGLWKDADPGLPEVEDARKRLAGIS